MARHDHVQRFCWDQILKTNRLFRVSHLFAPAQLSDQLLALYALFASLELLNCEVSDEPVARRKLDWWRGELTGRDAADSNHPVIVHLLETGAFRKLPESTLRLLLDSAESRIDGLTPTDEVDFLRLCRETYRPQVLLESALGGVDGDLNSFNTSVLFNGGLIQLLRESGLRKENAFWWVPVSLLARFKVIRNQLEAFDDAATLQALFTCMIELRTRSADCRSFHGQPGCAKGAGLVHLQLMTALQSRLLSRLQGMSPARYSSELARWRIGDLMTTWNRARQLNLELDQYHG